MNTYYKFLLIICLYITNINVLAQEYFHIDYNVIKENMEKDTLSYTRIRNRYLRNDTTITYPEYATLYYGYVFTPEYRGNNPIDKNNLERLINNQKYKEAYEMGQEILRKNPVALYALYNMYYLAQALEKPVQEANIYIIKYSKLLHTISLSGNGSSEETAFKVITTDDEYQLIYNYWGVEEIVSQSTVNGYDIIDFSKSQHYTGTKMYFDISQPLRIEREMLERDLW